MRGQDVMGRFSSRFETDSIHYGIEQDLRSPAGQIVAWYVYDPDNTVVDPIYDVGISGTEDGGRRWILPPLAMPVVNAFITQGETYQGTRGLYTVDNLTLILNYHDVEKILPDLLENPDWHLKDRIVYRDEVFELSRIFPKGQVRDVYTILRIDSIQIKPEELINDEPIFSPESF